jgi:hypothetical protein
MEIANHAGALRRERRGRESQGGAPQVVAGGPVMSEALMHEYMIVKTYFSGKCEKLLSLAARDTILRAGLEPVMHFRG